MEGLPGAQQQRVGGRVWQLRKPRPATDQKIFRWQSARVWRTKCLRPRDFAGFCQRQGGSGKTVGRIQAARRAKGSHELGTHRQQILGGHRALEAGQDRYAPRRHDIEHCLTAGSQPGHRLRTVPAFQ